MSGKIDKLYNAKDDTIQMLKMVRKLQSLGELKAKQIEALEKRIDDLEQHNRFDNVIMHGLKTRHKLWSRPVILNHSVVTHFCVARLPQVCRKTL